MSKKQAGQQEMDESRRMGQALPGGEDTAMGDAGEDIATGSHGSAPGIPSPEKETLLIPLDPNGGSDTVYLCVNGRNMLVKRGSPVKIPAEFAEAYRNAQAQQAAALHAQRQAMSED